MDFLNPKNNGGCMIMEKNTIDWIALILLIIGGLNWGLVGVFNFNLVNAIFGSVAWLESLIYILVGISGLWTIYFLTKK